MSAPMRSQILMNVRTDDVGDRPQVLDLVGVVAHELLAELDM